MKDRICTLSKNDLKDLVKTYRIPLDLHPHLLDHGFTMDRLPADAIGIYSEFLCCRDLNIVPTVTLFRVFQCLCKQGDWFSFSKRRNTKDVCMDDGPSSQKKWKDKFFLIDRKAILNYLTWRHSCSWVSDDIPSDECDPVFRRIDDNAEISIYDFMTLPSWSDAKIVEESHHLSLPLLERVPLHTTAPTSKDAIIMLPTPDEIVASLPDSPSSTASELDQAEGADEADLANLCTEIEDSLERDKAPASTSGHSLSLRGMMCCCWWSHWEIRGLDGEVMRRQMDPLDFFARSALARDAEYDQILNDDFGTATRGEEIDLTLFPLAPGPYHMPYPYEGVSYPLYTREEWNGRHALEGNILCKDIFKDPGVCRKALDQTITSAELRRTESLLPLELSNRVNVLSVLLVSHGYELNSRYANLVSSKAHLQEKFNKLENLQRGYDTLGQENRELHSQRDAASEE
ncbi:hypothetical protein Tco_0864579, partial [Tanacetum coccineum]